MSNFVADLKIQYRNNDKIGKIKDLVIARRLGVNIEFKKTSWPTLTADVLEKPQKFDLAIGGITITDARRETMLMSEGYLANGKTILFRASEADRYKSLADIDKPEVSVMVNPGGLNEQFANDNLTHATIIVHPKNEEIPALIAEGKADVRITEITEAPYYVQTDSRLAAPLLNAPFTHGEIRRLSSEAAREVRAGICLRIRQDYFPSYTPATTSISTNAPLGKVFTATAERAGYGSVKNSA